MPRRARVVRREVPPDPRYGSRMLQRFINKVMYDGKKSLAERLVYRALDLVQEQTRRNPLDVFEQALRNVTPVLEVKPRRVGGATYQVPVEIKGDRRTSLAMRWLIQSARARTGKSFPEKLAAELRDAAQGQGATVKRRDDVHRMAEANKAFAHYRW
ncbi:MAG TPA: 30S ribosomal protein S7 [Chloroflexota bacterium]|jgi:small subunit ribosomal protein S7|nr:30S ribosomal protein S7 [Chloroflexota bacterium]